MQSILILLLAAVPSVLPQSQYNFPSQYDLLNLPNQYYRQDPMRIQQNKISTAWDYSKTPAFLLGQDGFERYQQRNLPQPVVPRLTSSAVWFPRNNLNLLRQRLFNSGDEFEVGSQADYRTISRFGDSQEFFAPPLNYIGTVTELRNTKKNNFFESEAVDRSREVGVPPFLRGALPSVQKRFTEIVGNPDDNFLQKQQKLDNLMETLNEQNQQLYKQYQHSKEQEEQAKRVRIHETVATMSEKAQTAFAKISAVLTNRELSDGERWEKLQKLYSGTDENVRQEFDRRFTDLA